MDRPTLEALQRLMDVLRPLVDGKQLEDDWLRVTAWMDEANRERFKLFEK